MTEGASRVSRSGLHAAVQLGTGNIALDDASRVPPPLAVVTEQPVSTGAPVRDYRMRRMLLSADRLALVGGISTWLLLDPHHASDHFLWGLATLPLWALLFTLYGLYGGGLHRVGYATVDDIPAIGHALLIGTVGLWLYFQVTPPGKLVFSQLLVFALVAFTLALVLRNVARTA